MREISPKGEPTAFMEWRAGSEKDINYDYQLIPAALREEIKKSLIDEQRGLCAYTSIGVNTDRSHIEHLLPQAHCQRGKEDVDYRNMVACYPAPGAGYVPFGALPKANWPSRQELHLFVSPHSSSCEARFFFDLQGRISAKEDDKAAKETIKRLHLDNPQLTALRIEAIRATLRLHGKNPPLLDLPSARKRLSGMVAAENAGGRLEPFCFALKQALQKHIKRLESIRDSKRQGQSK